MLPPASLCGRSSAVSSVRTEVTVYAEKRSKAGLSGSHLDVVGRYLAEAQGPPPRAPLRFWIDGQWVEMSPPEPEPVVEVAEVVTAIAPVRLSPAAAEPEQGPLSAEPVSIDVLATPSLAPEPPLPIYEWLAADAGGDRDAVPDWPRSLIRPSRSRTGVETGPR
jgi:hypothetical protein